MTNSSSIRADLQEAIEHRDFEKFSHLLQSSVIQTLKQYDDVYSPTLSVLLSIIDQDTISQYLDQLELHVETQLFAQLKVQQEKRQQASGDLLQVVEHCLSSLLTNTSNEQWIDLLEQTVDFKKLFSKDRMFIIDQMIGNNNTIIFKKLWSHHFISKKDLLPRGTVFSFLCENIECYWNNDTTWLPVLNELDLTSDEKNDLMKELFQWSLYVNNQTWVEWFSGNPSLHEEYLASYQWIQPSFDKLVEQYTYLFTHNVWSQFVDQNQFLQYVFASDVLHGFFEDQGKKRPRVSGFKTTTAFLWEQFSVWDMDAKKQALQHNINKSIDHPLWVEFVEELLKSCPMDVQKDIVVSSDPAMINVLQGYIQKLYIEHALPNNGTARPPKKL